MSGRGVLIACVLALAVGVGWGESRKEADLAAGRSVAPIAAPSAAPVPTPTPGACMRP